jgi:hypothetical protein
MCVCVSISYTLSTPHCSVSVSVSLCLCRYDQFTDDWDTSEKQRCPSYTDRILFKAERCTQVFYGRNDTLKVSDHRPVMALFQMDFSIVSVCVCVCVCDVHPSPHPLTLSPTGGRG